MKRLFHYLVFFVFTCSYPGASTYASSTELHDLDDNLLMHTFSFLDPTSGGRAHLVCARWNTALQIALNPEGESIYRDLLHLYNDENLDFLLTNWSLEKLEALAHRHPKHSETRLKLFLGTLLPLAPHVLQWNESSFTKGYSLDGEFTYQAKVLTLLDSLNPTQEYAVRLKGLCAERRSHLQGIYDHFPHWLALIPFSRDIEDWIKAAGKTTKASSIYIPHRLQLPDQKSCLMLYKQYFASPDQGSSSAQVLALSLALKTCDIDMAKTLRDILISRWAEPNFLNNKVKIDLINILLQAHQFDVVHPLILDCLRDPLIHANDKAGFFFPWLTRAQEDKMDQKETREVKYHRALVFILLFSHFERDFESSKGNEDVRLVFTRVAVRQFTRGLKASSSLSQRKVFATKLHKLIVPELDRFTLHKPFSSVFLQAALRLKNFTEIQLSGTEMPQYYQTKIPMCIDAWLTSLAAPDVPETTDATAFLRFTTAGIEKFNDFAVTRPLLMRVVANSRTSSQSLVSAANLFLKANEKDEAYKLLNTVKQRGEVDADWALVATKTDLRDEAYQVMHAKAASEKTSLDDLSDAARFFYIVDDRDTLTDILKKSENHEQPQPSKKDLEKGSSRSARYRYLLPVLYQHVGNSEKAHLYLEKLIPELQTHDLQETGANNISPIYGEAIFCLDPQSAHDRATVLEYLALHLKKDEKLRQEMMGQAKGASRPTH